MESGGLRVGHFLLGIQGLAILRVWGDDGDAVEARRREIAEIIEGFHEMPLAGDMSMVEVSAAEGYAQMAEGYDRPANPMIVTEEPIVREILSSLPTGDALDAACGTGRHLAFLSQLGHRVIGVDQSPEMLRYAASKVANADVRVGSLESLPLEDNSVDLVTCSLALTHLPLLDKAIAEMSRVLVAGGRAVISDVHPFFTLIGGHASFRTGDGKMHFVRNYYHPVSRYLDAFRGAGLQPIRCVEAEWGDEAWETQTALKIYSEAGKAATDGLPLIVIWELIKPESARQDGAK